MQYSNLFPQTFQAAVIFEDIIGALKPGVAVQLRRNDGIRMRRVAVVARHDTFELLLDAAVDDENAIDQIGAFRLQQQGYRDNAVHGIEPAEPLPDFPVYQWMQQVFQRATKARICEDGLSEPVTQQGPLGVEILAAQGLVQPFADFFGFRKLACDDVGIDDRDPEVLLKDAGNGRLAAADPTCKAHY